jgi:hypothetical protein
MQIRQMTGIHDFKARRLSRYQMIKRTALALK